MKQNNKNVKTIGICTLIVVMGFGAFVCKKDKDEKTPLLATLYAMMSKVTVATSPSTAVSGATTLSANIPVGRLVTVAANSTVAQQVNISSSSSIQASGKDAQSRATTTPPIITLSLYKSDGSYVDGCADVVSTPGATSVILSCTITIAGDYVIQVKSTATATISFDAPTGATVTATSTGSNGFEPLSIVFSNNPTISATKNISLAGVISSQQVVFFIKNIDPTTKVATDVTDATVKVTFKGNTVTLPYATNLMGIAGVAGYMNSTSQLIPNYCSSGCISATGGDTISFVITGAGNSFTLEKTLTYPNAISAVKVNGASVMTITGWQTSGSQVSVSQSAGATITWTNPNTNPPQFIAINSGNPLPDISKKAWINWYPVMAGPGTYTLSSSALSTTTLTSSDSSDNCIGVIPNFTGNYTMFPTFYSGEYTENGTTINISSMIMMTNTSGFGGMGDGNACETNVWNSFAGYNSSTGTYAGGTWGTSEPNVTRSILTISN